MCKRRVRLNKRTIYCGKCISYSNRRKCRCSKRSCTLMWMELIQFRSWNYESAWRTSRWISPLLISIDSSKRSRKRHQESSRSIRSSIDSLSPARCKSWNSTIRSSWRWRSSRRKSANSAISNRRSISWTWISLAKWAFLNSKKQASDFQLDLRSKNLKWCLSHCWMQTTWTSESDTACVHRKI